MMADSNSPTLKWSTAFIANRWCIEAFLELSIEISIGSWLVKFAYPGIVIMNTLTLDLTLVMVRPSWDIASSGELASGVPIRPWMTFHIFVPSEFDTVFWRRSFQLSVLASLIALVASRQVLIHSCRFWWIAQQRLFWVQILACTCWAIQGLGFLLGFVFPTCIVAGEMRMSLKRDIRRDKFGSLGDYSF